ncbi:MAG: tRNA-dihydrouridine synthase family protein [Nanoarchaeota archaeon]|nr:tRNA-dihydrouridine synthase family protein [Nanoarchaeota archaeon]
MEDITSNAFRTLCFRYGADITFTELSRVESLSKNNKSTWSRIILKDNTPTIIQLLGAKESDFKRFLSAFKPSEGFEGFNLNLGCPSPHVVRLGQGCAMTRRIMKTKKVIEIFHNYGFKISVKLRLGLNKQDKQLKIYLNLIDAVDADFFVVHTRFGAQTYEEPADFSVYEDCVKTGKKIVANGDIKTREQVDYLKNMGIKGVMIGRAAVVNPAIFNQIRGLPVPDIETLKKEYAILAEKFNEPPKYKKNFLKHVSSLKQIHEP